MSKLVQELRKVGGIINSLLYSRRKLLNDAATEIENLEAKIATLEMHRDAKKILNNRYKDNNANLAECLRYRVKFYKEEFNKLSYTQNKTHIMCFVPMSDIDMLTAAADAITQGIVAGVLRP